MLLLQNFDGGSRGNPGDAGAGAVITNERTGEELLGMAFPMPSKSTNNEAEYAGLILGLHVSPCEVGSAPVV